MLPVVLCLSDASLVIADNCNVFAESIPQVYMAQVWQKTQVSQDNSFFNILITGNAPVRSRYET